MKNELDSDWWSELKFYNFYSVTLSIEDIKIIDELYNRSSDILNSITKDLYHFCDTVKYAWYHDYWKTNRFHEMDGILRKEIDKYNLKLCLNLPNLPYELSYDEIKESILKHTQEYICDFFSNKDLIEFKLKLGIV